MELPVYVIPSRKDLPSHKKINVNEHSHAVSVVYLFSSARNQIVYSICSGRIRHFWIAASHLPRGFDLTNLPFFFSLKYPMKMI